MDSNAVKQKEVVVVMVPFPAQGHLNQLLHLSLLVSTQGVAVHYVSTTTHGPQARRRVHGWDSVTISNIHFHEFPPLSFQSLTVSDPNIASTRFPSHLQPLFDASLLLRQPVSELLRDLSATSRRVVIIHDSLMGSVIQDFVNLPNAESYTFHSVSAFTIFLYLWETKGRPFSIDAEILENLPSVEGCFTPEFLKFMGIQHEYMNLNSGRIYNTCRVIENQFLELLAKPQISENKKQWALGPFNPVINTRTGTGGKINKESPSNSHHICLKWLDRQSPNSVIFVSFGSITSLSDEEIKELATGLEKSNVNFIWVLRAADGGDIFTAGTEFKKAIFPKGYEERIKDRGIIIRDWAPQLEILGHSATGGFLSHCGWNSCIESISMGVPIAAWPMHSDQPRNAVLITKVLKIGVTVKDWALRDEIVKSWSVATAVRKLMLSKCGEEMRTRAAEFGGAIRNAVVEGGVAHLELDSFISHITR